MRVGAINAGGELRRAVNIDFRRDRAGALAHVDDALALQETLLRRAADAGCDLAALPEDALGLGAWLAAHEGQEGALLPEAEARIRERLGGVAAERRMHVVVGTDTLGADGRVRNAAILLGPDGGEIGRYHKVHLPVHESLKTPGDGFPVFATDLGRIGLAICYDFVFPETVRCLALGGAELIVDPTQGGAAFGGPELSRAAFRVRAVENFVYLAVSWGGWGTTEGSLVISPRGDVLAEALTPGEIAIADIDPGGGRAQADWSNVQQDMRARIFRERRPEAYAAPALPPDLPPLHPGPAQEIARTVNRAITVGHGEFAAAEALREAGKTAEARAAYEALVRDYPATWFEQTARARLAELSPDSA